MYSLQVKSPWGSVKQNRDLVDITKFSKRLLKAGIAFAIGNVSCKGKMSERYLEHDLLFDSLSDLNIAINEYESMPKLKPDP